MVNQTASELSMSRGDVRKSKSKVRSYYKKCKDALYGQDTSIITVSEDPLQSSNTSWYLTTESNDSTNQTISDQLPKAMKTNQFDEQEAIDEEIKCMSMTETEPPEEKVREKFRNFKAILGKLSVRDSRRFLQITLLARKCQNWAMSAYKFYLRRITEDIIALRTEN